MVIATNRVAKILHDCHTIVRYDPPRASKVNDLMSFESQYSTFY